MWVPRIKLTPKDDLHPYRWTRTQFPVRPAFAMTINKSQGQTIRGRVGLYLPEPVFSHGQLYVGASRVTDEANCACASRRGNTSRRAWSPARRARARWSSTSSTTRCCRERWEEGRE